MTNWILIPFLDNWPLTQVAAEDALAQTLPGTRVLLIDNGSRDADRAACQTWVTQHLPRAMSWHHNPPLRALGQTWNHALRFVWESGGTHALVVNNDVRLHPATYETLYSVQQATGAWMVTGVSVRAETWAPSQLYYDERQPWEAPGMLAELRGGPDFSCFLLTEACHRWFLFDEGFIPAYHEDNDFHRRLQLAGFGDKIFGVNAPFLHLGSATINRTPEAAAAFRPKFEACRAYYVEKWGGVPGQETYTSPFNRQDFAAPGGPDPRAALLGQGKWELPLMMYRQATEALYGQAAV